MPEPKYTPDGLPVVSEATCQAYNFLLKRSGKDLGTCLEDYCSRLRKENPVLAEGLGILANARTTKGDSVAAAILLGSFMTYDFLRRQAAANKLEREIEGK